METILTIIAILVLGIVAIVGCATSDKELQKSKPSTGIYTHAMLVYFLGIIFVVIVFIIAGLLTFL